MKKLTFEELSNQLETIPDGKQVKILGGDNEQNYSGEDPQIQFNSMAEVLAYVLEHGIDENVENRTFQVDDDGTLHSYDVIWRNGELGYNESWIESYGDENGNPTSSICFVTWHSLNEAYTLQQSFGQLTHVTDALGYMGMSLDLTYATAIGADYLSSFLSGSGSEVLGYLGDIKMLRVLGETAGISDIFSNMSEFVHSVETGSWGSALNNFAQMVVGGVGMMGYFNPVTGVFVGISMEAWERLEDYIDGSSLLNQPFVNPGG